MSNLTGKTSCLPAGRHRIFLLSPASMAGVRAARLMSASPPSAMARRLRNRGVSLGELFSFLSSLYFRGKLAYARTFSSPPRDLDGSLVITARGGLLSSHARVTLDELQNISAGDLDPSDERYRIPLVRDAHILADRIGADCEIVLLGSIATSKYVAPLLDVFGARLLFPAEFVGRGDMSRGGLMLRCVESGEPLSYVPVLGAMRHGNRPPKLKPLAPGTLSALSSSSSPRAAKGQTRSPAREISSPRRRG